MLNDPRNDADSDISLLINMGYNKGDGILFSDLSVIIAGVCNGVDADTEPYKDSTFMNIFHGSGVFALDLAKRHICFAGIPFYAFDICFDGNIFRIFRIHRQDTDKEECQLGNKKYNLY